MCRQTSRSFFAHFATLQDPRIERSQRHALLDILFIAVCALLSGANDFVGMEKFGKSKQGWLKRYVSLPNGIPSHDTFGRVIQALEPQEFVHCFLHWVQAFRETADGQHICIDGKTARASLDRGAEQNPLHVVSAWATEQGLVLGQVAVDEKSNEITAIPKLLEMLELEGALVTIDALGCQKDIAQKIQDGGGDYVLVVKGNQDHLEEDIMAAFGAADTRRECGCRRGLPDGYETEDHSHGRAEVRRCEALPVPTGLRNRDHWAGLESIGRVTRTYTERGEEKSEVRYVISSLSAQAERLGKALRGHWGIENGLHWVLDMAFAEDRSRARQGHAQENLGLLRRWAMSVLRQDNTLTGSIEKRRLQAGWNERNLENLLNLF